MRIRICIIIPATAIDEPVSTIANVRGRRLMNMTCWLSDSENTSDQRKSATPTDRLTANNTAYSRRFTRLREKGLAVINRREKRYGVGDSNKAVRTVGAESLV